MTTKASDPQQPSDPRPPEPRPNDPNNPQPRPGEEDMNEAAREELNRRKNA